MVHEEYEAVHGVELFTRSVGTGPETVVLHGRHDPILISTARETAQLLGASLHAVGGSEHVPYIEDEETSITILDYFLPSR